MYYNDGTIRVRKSTYDDAVALSKNMRESDKDEVWASNHLTPGEALGTSLKESTFCLTVENGSPIAMFGVVPQSIMGKAAVVWLLASDDLYKIKGKFLKYSRNFIDIMLSKYPYLYNFVDARNKKSIQWLKMCGAQIDPAEPYGAERLPFHYFSFEKNVAPEVPNISNVLNSLNLREKTDVLQKAMMEIPGITIGDNENCPLTHKFCDGSYVRTISMPKGMLIVSKIHKKRHPYFILSGDVSVATEAGVTRIKGPYQGITEPGTRRVLYINEDTIWTTVHVTDKTDIEEIEQEIIAKSFDEIELKEDIKCLG